MLKGKERISWLNWRIFPGGFHVLYIPDPLDDARLMMKALASGHGKAAINAVMIYFPAVGAARRQPAGLPYLRDGNGMSNFIHCKTTTEIKPYCKKPGDNSHCLCEGTLRLI